MPTGKGVLWNGKYYLIPQAASRIDSSALSNSPLGGANKVAFLAEMTGLVPPKTPIKISNPSLANQLIHPNCEEARLGASLLFDPSPTEIGSSEVYLIAINPSSSAQLTLKDAGTNDVITLTSYLYGTTANQVYAKVETGTNKGKRITIGYQDNTEVIDDLAKDAFKIVYAPTAGGDTCSMTIDVATEFKLTTACSVGADALNISLLTYDTVQSLCDYINSNGNGKYTATILTRTPKKDKSLNVDAVAAQNIKTEYTVTANLQAFVDGINQKSGYVSAVREADAGAAPANLTKTFLSGGTDCVTDTLHPAGVTVMEDWQDALDTLKAINIDLVVPLTGDPAVHFKVDSHCRWMSGPNGKSERRCFVGGELQTWNGENNRITSLTALTNAVKLINSDRTVHVGLGSRHYDANGDVQLYPAYITACMYCGIAGGASPVTPLTRRYLRCLGLEADLRISEIEQMMETAVAVPIPDTVRGAGYVISRQLTTWNADDDLYRIEFSVGRGADYVAREVRNRHEILIGKPGTEWLDVTIVNLTNSVLELAKRDDLIRNYDPKKTQLRADNTIRYVDYWAEPILPVNWIFSTYHLQPTKFSIGL